jgi:hypothetical protein
LFARLLKLLLFDSVLVVFQISRFYYSYSFVLRSLKTAVNSICLGTYSCFKLLFQFPTPAQHLLKCFSSRCKSRTLFRFSQMFLSFFKLSLFFN